MQKRYESKNIPIEILRSFVTVVETGSYTKAGELLNLSQAAVSAQIARLRRILRGELFTRGAERRGAETPGLTIAASAAYPSIIANDFWSLQKLLYLHSLEGAPIRIETGRAAKSA